VKSIENNNSVISAAAAANQRMAESENIGGRMAAKWRKPAMK
jgi:hypothetical protein